MIKTLAKKSNSNLKLKGRLKRTLCDKCDETARMTDFVHDNCRSGINIKNYSLNKLFIDKNRKGVKYK